MLDCDIYSSTEVALTWIDMSSDLDRSSFSTGTHTATTSARGVTSELHALGDGAFSLSARGSKDHAEYQPDASTYWNPQTHIAEGRAEYNAQRSAHNEADADVILFHGPNIARNG
jgi:hypothetical protein